MLGPGGGGASARSGGWRSGLGLGLAPSVKSKHEDLDSILRTYVRQAGHDGAVITPTLGGTE